MGHKCCVGLAPDVVGLDACHLPFGKQHQKQHIYINKGVSVQACVCMCMHVYVCAYVLLSSLFKHNLFMPDETQRASE